MREKTRDTVFAGVLLAVNGLFWLETQKPQYKQVQAQDYGFDPAFFPQILLVLWAIFSVVIIVCALLSQASEVESPVWRRFFYGVAITGIYLLAMSYIGFLFASIPFAAAFMLIFGYRHRIILPLIAVVFPTVIWWLFVFPLHMPLPISPWFSRL